MAVDQNLDRKRLSRWRRWLPLGVGVRRASGKISSASRPLSTVAILAILALILDWLAQTLEWSAPTLVPGVNSFRIEGSGSSFPTWLNYLALAIFVWAGILSAVQLRRPRLPRFVPLFLAIMLAYGTVWVILGYEPAEYRFALGTVGPLLFVMCLGVYAGLDPTLWQRLRPIVLALAYASVTLGLYYSVRLSVKSVGIFEGPTPMNRHMQTAFWFGLCALALRKSSRLRDCVSALVPIAFCMPIAIVAGSRSLTFLTILGLLTGLLIPIQYHLRSIAARALALGILAPLVFGVGFWFLSLAAPERVLALKDRMREDTRSSQYSQFFRQVPLEGLLTGLGPKATYTYNEWVDYEYIDNQFLFILFKFGLPVLLGYCAVVLWPGLRMLVNAADSRQRSLGLFFAFWTLASLGISIFHGITNNPQNFIAILLAGRCFLLTTSSGQFASGRQGSGRFMRAQASSGKDTQRLAWTAPPSRTRP